MGGEGRREGGREDVRTRRKGLPGQEDAGLALFEGACGCCAF